MTNKLTLTQKIVKFIQWIVDVRSSCDSYSEFTVVSDTFSCQDRECNIKFTRHIEQCNSCKLYFESCGVLQHPASATVRVLSGPISLGTTSTTSITTEKQIIWSYRGDIGPLSLLNIEVTIECDYSKEDKCIQTASYLNTDLSAEGLHKDFSELLSTGLNHDIELKCEEKSLKAHKIVLSARSGVFKAMLESDMQESRTGVVEIKDMDVRYFQDFVRYLYTDTMPELTLDVATVLYEAGDKYGVRSLMLRCSEYFQDILSRENAFQCSALADAHSDQKLKDEIISYISDKKLYHLDEYWSSFCESYPKFALEVYRLLHKKNFKDF